LYKLYTQFSVIHKLAEGVADDTAKIIGKDTEERWSEDRSLGVPLISSFHLNIEQLTVDHNSVSVTIQPITYLPSSPSFKSPSLKFRDMSVVQDHVKGVAEVHVNDISCTAFID